MRFLRKALSESGGFPPPAAAATMLELIKLPLRLAVNRIRAG